MIRSPGTKRRAALPVPEEVQLKLRLLGVELLWDRSKNGWMMFMFNAPDPSGRIGHGITALEVLQDGWDAILARLADQLTKPTAPVPAAAVINEDAFNVAN